jgi:peptidyl-prolyl cis-trans isomerase C
MVMLALVFCFGLFAGQAPAAEKKGKEPGKAAPAQKKEPAAATKESPSTGKNSVAVVNGVVISKAEMDKELQRCQKQVTASGQEIKPEQLTEVKKGILQSLISREVLYQESQKRGVKATDAEVDQKLKELQSGFPSDAEYKAALQQMNLTEAELRSQLTRQMTIKKLVDLEVMDKITISDEDAKAFYEGNPERFKVPEQVRASHILIKVEPKASDEDKAKARQELVIIQERIKKGEDFAALAKELSKDPGSASRGGDLNFFQRGQMVGPFDKVAFELKPGEVSDIVETQFGYHLIKVTDKKAAGTMSYDEVKDRIMQFLKQEKTNSMANQYIEQLKAHADIMVTYE